MDEQPSEQAEVRLTPHPDAKANLDEQGEALLRQVSVVPRNLGEASFVPDYHVAAAFTADQITNVVEFRVLPGGRTIERTFPHDDKAVGFVGEAHEEFARFCQKLQRTKPLPRYISLDTIEQVAFEWVRARYTGTTGDSVTNYVLSTCEPSIQEYEVWIPIYHTHVPCDLEFGTVVVKTFTAAMFDVMRDEFRARRSPEEDKLIAFVDSLQRRFQAMAAVTLRLRAEPRRAYEVTREEGEKVAAILRLFSQSAFVPEVMSCCVLMGQKDAQYETYLVFQNGQLVESPDGLSTKDQAHWVVGPDQLKLMGSSGIAGVIELFFKEKKTKFEQDVFESMMTYSRGLMSASPNDKIIYAFSALESLMLKDDNEPILANVPRRIAYVVASKPSDRLQVINNYKAAYAHRSGYVHHGRSIDDDKSLTEFLQVVFRFFFGLVHREVPKHKTTGEFIAALDLLALSGGVPPDLAS